MIPIPDFDFSDDDDAQPADPPAQITSAITFALGSDPVKSFTSRTPNGLFFDKSAPIYETKTCTLYICRSDDSFYALKCSHNIKLLNREFQMYKEVGQCLTIINAIDYWVQSDRAYMQLELATGGSISNLFNDFPRNEVWRVIAHITVALFQIHSSGYMHLDVSPSNILQTTIGDVVVYKLADFGTVIPVGSFQMNCEGAGPYASPEALAFPDTPYVVGPESDIWSFGAVIYELITHKRAPRDRDGYSAFRNGTFDLSGIPPEFKIVERMLNPNPNERPTIQEMSQIDEISSEIGNLVLRTSDIKEPQYRNLFRMSSNRRKSFDSI